MTSLKALFSSLLMLISISGFAESLMNHGASSEEIQNAIEQNDRWHQRQTFISKPLQIQPVEDTAPFAYVLMSSYDSGEDEFNNLRKTIASHLPANVKLVILTNSSSAASIRKKYLKWIEADKLIIAIDSHTETGFWARDSFPVPVYTQDKKVMLIAAKYFRKFTSWQAIARSVKAPMKKMDFTFVGGNLLADEEGNCFAVNSDRLFSLNEEDLKAAYGCKTVHLFNHLRGIGDVDEVLKPLPNKHMLTNVPEYKNDLVSMGYEVVMLPALPGTYRTYANSLIVHKTVFMPIFNVPQDKEAKQIYTDLGYKVIPIKSNNMSDYFNGSVHCQTMAYPSIQLNELFKFLGAKEYKP